jgi:DNA polymerase-3 subunit gamma/tau
MEEKNKRNTKEKKSNVKVGTYTLEALEYIAKIADGGCRDGITLVDKALSYSKDLTLDNVVKAIGTTQYSVMFKLTDAIIYSNSKIMLKTIDDIHAEGKDLKRFIKTYIQFLLDVNKYALGCEWEQIGLPHLKEYEQKLDKWLKDNDIFTELLNIVVVMDSDIKYSATPKYDIEARLLLYIEKGGQ